MTGVMLVWSLFPAESNKSVRNSPKETWINVVARISSISLLGMNLEGKVAEESMPWYRAAFTPVGLSFSLHCYGIVWGGIRVSLLSTALPNFGHRDPRGGLTTLRGKSRLWEVEQSCTELRNPEGKVVRS